MNSSGGGLSDQMNNVKEKGEWGCFLSVCFLVHFKRIAFVHLKSIVCENILSHPSIHSLSTLANSCAGSRRSPGASPIPLRANGWNPFWKIGLVIHKPKGSTWSENQYIRFCFQKLRKIAHRYRITIINNITNLLQHCPHENTLPHLTGKSHIDRWVRDRCQ